MGAALVLEQFQKVRDLPVLSVVRSESLDLLSSKKSTRRDLAQALKYDQVLSAKILRLVNSASYGLQKNISNVEKALGFLGDNTLQMLFLGSNVFSPQDLKPPFQISEFWTHNYLVAFASSEIARVTQKADPSESFSCGLLHDLGKLALWKTHPALFCLIREEQAKSELSFFEAESKLQLPGHHVLGEEVAKAWSLPFSIRKTMRFHHREVWLMESLEEKLRYQVGIVILANQVVKRLKLGSAWGLEEERLTNESFKYLGFSRENALRLEQILTAEAANAYRYLFKS